jgi:GntR family transcriptional regulator / MocR family aminotransferase
LAKKAIFQDLPVMPLPAGEERWRWLYGQLRAAILDRRLRPGARMPSSRNLAKQHGVSRGTVVAAFDHLRSEGYVEMRAGAGAFVATTIPDEAIAVTKRKVGDTRKQATRATLSKRGLLSAQDVLPLPASLSLGKAFRAWEPAIDLFPTNLWSRIAGRVLRRAPHTARETRRDSCHCARRSQSTLAERAECVATLSKSSSLRAPSRHSI